MTATRADQTRDLLETVYGPLDQMPRHTPVIRRDVPLKPARTQVDRRTNWPTEPVNSQAPRPLPASCSRTSIDGENMAVFICVGVLLVLGLIAIVSSFSHHDLLAYLLEGLQ